MTVYVGGNFDMLITDLSFWPIFDTEKVTNTRKRH